MVSTINYVLPVDMDVVVTVAAGLLVVKAQGMKELMLDGAVVQAALTGQRHSLGITLTANIGVTSGKKSRGESRCTNPMPEIRPNLII